MGAKVQEERQVRVTEERRSWRIVGLVLLVALVDSLGYVLLNWAVQMAASRDIRRRLTPCMTMEEARAALPAGVEIKVDEPRIVEMHGRSELWTSWTLNESENGTLLAPRQTFVLSFEKDKLTMVYEKRDIGMDGGFKKVFDVDCGGE